MTPHPLLSVWLLQPETKRVRPCLSYRPGSWLPVSVRTLERTHAHMAGTSFHMPQANAAAGNVNTTTLLQGVGEAGETKLPNAQHRWVSTGVRMKLKGVLALDLRNERASPGGWLSQGKETVPKEESHPL